ncbi:DHS-like NAD/FAD-binding domain-containing protein [Daedaleopsis nitida]|nr:DHS-like NAD/FAD-binding domain-containing protein [Daedaleopsis nitida]
MTAFLPLEASAPLPPSPAFLIPSPDPGNHMKRVIKAVLKARRIAVVCGAGISVNAGIPDFRSSEGLFQTLKKVHPTLSSGKDLFDASVFNSEDTTSLFCQMIAQLSQLSEAAQPTDFHRFLRVLDERRRLLRVYTQNIDALEEKSGLTFGVPELDGKRYKPRSAKGTAAPIIARPPDEPSTSRLPSPPVETPRCIPLHGTLQLMHCQTCTHSYPLRDHLDSLTSGTPPPCPQCTALEATRQLIGKRSRGVGRLRPSVVLYNEDHKDGEEVGNVVRKDLMGNSKGKGRAGADLLLVVGTSLRVPGTKRIVREFSKAVRSRHAAMNQPADEPSMSAHGLATPTPSPRRSPAGDDEPPVRTIYLNLDFPVPTREWENVFDVWIRGDAQDFARLVHEELERDEQAKEAVKERRRRKEQAAEMARQEDERRREEDPIVHYDRLSSGSSQGKTSKTKKRKEQPQSGTGGSSAKKRKTITPPSPVSPPSKAVRREKTKTKRKTQLRRQDGSNLPTPPASQDSSKLRIRLPPRQVEVVIPSTPSKNRRITKHYSPSSSPLSTPPSSACSSPSSTPSKVAINDVPSFSSPLSSPPPSNAGSPRDKLWKDPDLSPSPLPQVAMLSPPRLHIPSQRNRTVSLSPPPQFSPHSMLTSPSAPLNLSLPRSMPRSPRGTQNASGQYLGKRPGIRSYLFMPESEVTIDNHDDDAGSVIRSESGFPWSHLRTEI